MPAKKPAPMPSRAARLKAFAKQQVSPFASLLSLGVLSAVAGTILYAEHEYAHAADVRQQFSVDGLRTEIGQYEIRLQLAQQDLTQLSYAPGPKTPVIRQELERRGEVVRALGQELASKKALYDRLRSGK